MSAEVLDSADRGAVEAGTSRLDASLELLRPHFPASVAAPESLDRVRPVASLFPTSAVDFFGFECRLGEAGPTLADCALNLTPDGARLLAGRHPGHLAWPGAGQAEAWSRLRSFYEQWGDTHQPPWSDAGCTWLEFDTSVGEPAPNLLFGYWPRREADRRSRAWLVDTILPLLLGPAAAADLGPPLTHCLEACPPEAGDFQVGFMLSRALPVIRLCLFDLPVDGIFPYLERVGWRGPDRELQRLLAVLRPHADFLGLHLDVGAQSVFPHIGIEPNYTAGCWTRQPHTEPRWHSLLAELLGLGLATPEQRDALLGWTGHQRLQLGPRTLLLLRGLSHVKVVLRPHGEILAKVYFGIAHRTLADAREGDRP